MVEKKNFTKFYQDYIKDEFYKKLSNKMLKDINTSNMKQQWEIIHLYMMFVFVKGDPEENKKTKYQPYLTKNNIMIKEYEPVFNKGTFE